MASEWAEEADRQAKAITRDLIEIGKTKDFRVEYQKREARFALRAGTVKEYFSAHDYTKKKGGMDWLKLRTDILSSVRRGMQEQTENDESVEDSAG
jgi:ABC-type nitrate/sulfonate/bicarbonate transport system substrate-binding protein